MIKIAPSTNPEKEDNLLNYVRELESAKIDFLHCDVMDGIFVENQCLKAEKLYEISQNSTIALDVHLMVDKPILVYKSYLKSKPTILTVHYESFKNINNLLYILTQIKKEGIMAGISIKPLTDISEIEPILPLCDLVLIMSVEPGKSGQKFIESTIQKVKNLKSLITLKKHNIKIEVDGGIDHTNIKQLRQAGCDIAVVGSAVYKAQNKIMYINKLKELSKSKN